MRIDGIALASGEDIVRRYTCTVAGRSVELAGSVLPFGRKCSGEGVITLTDRRLMFDADAGERRDGSPGGAFHQEMSISDVSSIATTIARVPRGVLLPVALVLLGLALMLVPYAATAVDGTFDLDGDYQDGYNDGIEAGYYYGYLHEVQNPNILTRTDVVFIPEGYHFDGKRENASAEYERGYAAGYELTSSSGTADAVLGKPFSVPTYLMTHYDPWSSILSTAAAGAVLVVAGSLVYSLSGITGEWAAVRIGSSGRGVYISSVSGGWSASSHRGISPSEGYEEMVRDLGAAILEARSGSRHTTALRVEDDDDDDDAQPRSYSVVDRGEDGGVDEYVPDLYDSDGSDDGIVLSGGHGRVP